ncbi:hypothetical protein ACFPVT_02435 [Corynebacterium choanae]|uniref:Uncharacterized protein n=1 Tax=Corynebacterium choanae TaxID=1862358 RepID=A0A3G6J4N4_9CORY|nr:hypothetical protein [Corynebacterium choanae]AZA12906.1 hypothetical protein CCHOA_02445 [Corynebacterium choanae]
MRNRVFRDRHGRGQRGVLLPPAVPAAVSRATAFHRLVAQTYLSLTEAYRDNVSGLAVAVDWIPRMRLNPDEVYFADTIVADGAVPIARLIPPSIDAQGNTVGAYIVVFRAPLVRRARDPQLLVELLEPVLAQLIATYLNLDERDILPDFQPWWN